MTGTGSTVATRPNGGAPAQQSGSAVAIRRDQSEFDDRQKAALVAMGVSEKATRAELAVFFHQCRNTQLDPFLKQIYLIHRRAKEGDRWVDKPTIQTGIDGFRVIRDRIADKKGLRVEYEDTVWYDGDRQAYDVWVWDEPPAACKVVVLVDGRRFPSVLRFNEYCQFGREDDSGSRPRTGRWRDGHAHQIEKCAEADALRKAFPNDMAGLVLEDAAPLSDPDAPDRLPSDRPRVTADQARQRAPQRVTAEVVTPDASPAGSELPAPQAAAPSAVPPAGDAPSPPKAASDGQVGIVNGHLERLGYAGDDQRDARLRVLTVLANRREPLATSKELTADEAAIARRRLEKLREPVELQALLEDMAADGDPREDGEPGGE